MENSNGAGNGLFVVIEGTDGSGKTTQFKQLKKRLEGAGYDVAVFDFPQYDKPSSYFVKEYLNGNYGGADEVGPYTASLFFALDRYEAASDIRAALDAGKIVLANRFTGSNMAHQGTKFVHAEERRGYFIWLDNLEFQMLHIPRPNLSIVLRMPAEIAQTLVDKKDERSYTDKKRDIHEADLAHLQKSVEVYDDLCQLFPKDFTRIDCVRSGNLLDKTEVGNLIWEKLSPNLPPAPAKPKKKKAAERTAQQPSVSQPVPSDENPYVEKWQNGTKITHAGRDFLAEAVTNADGNVYGFSDKLTPTTIAAAMARLSRRADDMRVTILDEFAHAMGKDAKLLQRVITAYGDDSVQQLVGVHMVVENASNLLTKKLEWGRLAAYLEQSTRYIYFDQKDANGKYRYYVPEHFEEPIKKAYISVMDALFGLYSSMVHRLTDHITQNSDTPQAERDVAWKGAVRAQACDAVRSVLPTATKSTVGIFASGQALESLIMHLQSDELPEAREVGEQLLQEGRKVMPTFLERADKPERGGAMVAYRATTRKNVKNFAETNLTANHVASGETPAVTMTDIWPRNELDLVADMLYEFSDQPLESIREDVKSWPYEKKFQAFEVYMGERLNRRHRPGRALEKAHYSWDLVCDYGIFRDLQRHRMVDDMEWQALTPRFGYEIPDLIDQAGLTEMFEQCFDLSLQLYSALQQAGYATEAQYATLLGHRMRWKVTYNAREAFHLHELRTSPQGHPGYRKLVLQMHDKLAQKHPLLAAAMKFVNTDEDAALTRLAAERYTQFKLNNL